MTRVLLCDDNRTALNGLQALLELDGFSVVAVSSGAEGIRRAAEERFDVLITDLEMPEVHGLDVLRRVRELKPELPTMVITAYAQSPASQLAQELGVRAVLPKPLDYDGLLAELGKLGFSATPA